MFFRYVAVDEKNGKQKGLLRATFMILDETKMTKKDEATLNKIADNIDNTLSFPTTRNGLDLYAYYPQPQNLRAWFTGNGEDEFGKDMKTLMKLFNKYAKGYRARRITAEKLDNVVYSDFFQAVAG